MFRFRPGRHSMQAVLIYWIQLFADALALLSLSSRSSLVELVPVVVRTDGVA